MNKIYSAQLLDNALHHSAMKNLKNSTKRGRPDITHLCLLNALGSPLNKSGNLVVYIHTIKNKIFKFNPEIRIAKNFNRFKGLMAKLLIDGAIKYNNTNLISQFSGNLKQLIDSFQASEILLFSNKGRLITKYQDIITVDPTKNIIAIIGGFQKSTFSEEILKLSNSLISISNFPLEAWIVVSKVINYYEIYHNII
jgi:rRNA small subunit pseudouridine methyltransferase Nep1